MKLRRSDAAAAALLVALPVLVFGVPALLGHPILPGDDLTQNFPLRVLAGRDLASGQLPLLNPYIWGGAPLLAGWNAGAAYPLTLGFAVLPPAAAWTLNMIATWAVAGLGMFCFLRALRLGPLPGLLGALSFAFAGAMPAQIAHFGLVAGLSWVPFQLLSILRLTEADRLSSRLGWTGVLAAAAGMTILAGEPRAIADAGVIVVAYAAWQIARLGRRCGPAALSAAAGLGLGACLGAVQWLPGLAVVGASQRGASSVVLFNSGSLPHRWLLLMLVPDLLGGSGSFGQPRFFANYNLAEVTGYVGVLPLVAAAALLARVRLRPRLPEWIVWHFLALAGIVLALGGNTPAGRLLVQLPFFGGLRLQSRNILVTDLALAVLLAYWADRPAGDGRPAGNRRAAVETILGILPPLAVIGVVVLALAPGPGLLHWLRASPGPGMDGRLAPWLIPYALLGAGAIGLVIVRRRLPAALRTRVLAWFAGADLVVFTLLALVAVGAGAGAGAAGDGGGARTGTDAGASAGTGPAPALRPVADLGYPGRFAIYDPGQLAAQELPRLGAPDLNVLTGTPSVQGYSAVVAGFYAAATGSHQAMGKGQNILAVHAIGDGTLDQLGTSVLLTPPGFLMTGRGAAAPAGPPGTGRREVAAGQRASWFFGAPLAVSRLTVPDATARQDAAAGIRIGLVTRGGPVRWLHPRAAGGSLLAAGVRRPVTAVAVTARAGRRPGSLGPPSVSGPGRSVLTADGQLQDVLTQPRWAYAGRDGSFALFADRFARAPLSLAAAGGRAEPGALARPGQGASVRAEPGGTGGGGVPGAAAVASPHGVRVIRSMAAIAGWSATWQPRHGPAVTLPVRRAGLVQAVGIPPGRGVVTWSYQPTGFTAGWALSLGAVLLVLALVTLARAVRAREAQAAATAEQPVESLV